MPYVQIPKDLTQVKTKVALNLTKRQLICFSCAAITAVPFYLLARKPLGSTVAALGLILIALPFFAFAMYERDGQPLEKYLMNIIQARYLRPRVRKYQTQNFYTYLNKQAKQKKEDAKIAKTYAAAGQKKKTGAGTKGAGKPK